MYLSVGQEPPARAEGATATAFTRAAISLLGALPGPFGLVAMTPDLGVRVLDQPKTQSEGEAQLAVRVKAGAGDLFLGLFRRDDEAPKGWWMVSVQKLEVGRAVKWAAPAAMAAGGVVLLWWISRGLR